MSKLSRAFEELNVDILKEQQNNDNGSEFDELYLNIKNDVDYKNDIETEEETEDTIDESGDVPVDDSESTDVPKDDNDEEQKPSDKEETELKEASESAFRNSFNEHLLCLDLINELKGNIACEFKEPIYVDEVGHHYTNKILHGIDRAAGAAFDKGKELSYKYGSVALKHLGKGLSAILNSTYKFLNNTISTLLFNLKRRMQSYKSHSKKIDSAIKTLNLLKENQLVLPEGLTYNNKHVIDKLKITDSVDIVKNLEVADAFLHNYYDNILHESKNISNSLITLMDEVSNNRKIANKTYIKIPDFKNFVELTNSDYKLKVEGVDSKRYNKHLPGNLIVVAYLPSKNIKENQAINVYKNCKMFFGYDARANKNFDSMEYANTDNIEKTLNLLKQICDYGIKQSALYENIISDYKRLSGSYTKYTDHLLKSKENISIQNSMMEVISPAVHLFGKVYVTSMIDVDDYFSKLITNTLEYIKDSMKKYNPS